MKDLEPQKISGTPGTVSPNLQNFDAGESESQCPKICYNSIVHAGSR